MDKLRALEYLVSAAEGNSLSAAARRHDVSVGAVAKLISALEATIGVPLIERRPTGIALTTAGAMLLTSSRTALEQLREAEHQARATVGDIHGTVTVGVQPVIAQEVLTAALPRFHALYPEVQLDIRYFMRPNEVPGQTLDTALVMGWPQGAEDFVHRPLGATTFVIVAAPGYWAAHGTPRHPSQLEQHNCLTIRSNRGSVMDLWHFRRGEERVSITARGWLFCDNVHRDMVRDLVLAGQGVARLLDWHQRPGREVARGLLTPALTDWVIDEVPPVNLLYRPGARRAAGPRAFIDWVVQLFDEVERDRQRPLPATELPRWMKARHARASSTR